MADNSLLGELVGDTPTWPFTLVLVALIAAFSWGYHEDRMNRQAERDHRYEERVLMVKECAGEESPKACVTRIKDAMDD